MGGCLSWLLTGRSVGAYFYSLGSAAISWKSRYSTQVHPSSTESEVAALYMATSEAVWIRKLLAHLGYLQKEPTTMAEDNQGAIKWANGDDRSGRLKHVDLKFLFIRERILADEIKLTYIKSQDNPADILTKPLTGSKFLDHRSALGVTGVHGMSRKDER